MSPVLEIFKLWVDKFQTDRVVFVYEQPRGWLASLTALPMSGRLRSLREVLTCENGRDLWIQTYEHRSLPSLLPSWQHTKRMCM